MVSGVVMEDEIMHDASDEPQITNGAAKKKVSGPRGPTKRDTFQIRLLSKSSSVG